ncbi:MAG: hypothetical protein NXI12_05485 [Alphaproteobacteria bacterium]|nr:hypothetical protein [Alphaproteobacteria bacterium]
MFYASLYSSIALVALFSLATLVWWAIKANALKAEAREEYAARVTGKPATVSGVSEPEFVSIYVRSFQPRWALYGSGGSAAVLAVSPVALIAVPAVYEVIWRAGGAPDWGGTTGYVYMFVLFFGLVLIWALVAAFFARQHHVRTPEPFNHALARARGEPLPEDTGWRRRPKWARRARPDPQDSDA